MLWIALLVAPFGAVTAQSASDAAKTIVGISVGVLPGGTLWEVGNQPITPITLRPAPPPYAPDIVDIRRDLVSRRPVISVHATRFVNPHVGLTGEFTHFALDTKVACTVVTHGGDPVADAICAAVAATLQGTAATDVIQAGVVLRGAPTSVIQPYVSALAGIALTPQSTATLRSDYASDISATIYTDPGASSVQPSWTLGAGLATIAVPGLQAHVEVRDSWISQSLVTGPSAGQGMPTPVEKRYRGFVSVLIGFDLVLAKSRGRRY